MTPPTLAGRAVAVVAGVALDRLLGDPPDRWHPVAWHGSAMAAVERRAWRDHRLAGAAHAAAGTALAAGAGRLAGGPGARGRRGLAATAAVTAVVVGGRGLDRAADAVARALDAGDLAAARAALPSLVGRDPAQLDATGIARAVVESVAENTVDAVVAPALWALAGGPAGAAAYRGINTMDAMVGHRGPRHGRYGWTSARLDDAANLVPARVTAALVAAVRPRAAGAVWRAVRRDAPAHPSPNAGVAEAAWAAALGVRLGGRTAYPGRVEDRPALGDGRDPVAADIARARRLAAEVAATLAAALAGPAAARLASTRRTGTAR